MSQLARQDDLAASWASARGARRCGCGAPGAGIVRSLAQESELIARHPKLVASVIMARQINDPAAPAALPTFKSKYGNLVIIGEVYPCRNCWTTAERAAAKHPSWILVEFDRPHSSKVQVGRPVQRRARRH